MCIPALRNSQQEGGLLFTGIVAGVFFCGCPAMGKVRQQQNGQANKQQDKQGNQTVFGAAYLF